jgi:cytochrome c-type biogenesis protein
VGVLPLLVAYITQYPLRLGRGTAWWGSALQASLFVLGLALTLMALGLLSVALGQSLQGLVTGPLWLVLGLLTLAMGAATLGWWHPPWPQAFARLPVLAAGPLWSPLLLGLAYGLVATPCGSPLLIVVLAMVARASVGDTPAWGLGALALFAYGLGQGLLLVIAGTASGVLAQRATLAGWGHRLTLVAGWFMLALGTWWSLQGLGLL